MENDFQKIMPSCLLCRTEAIFFGSKWGYHLYRCPRCRFLFVYPTPTETTSVYNEGYFMGGEGGVGYADYDRDKAPMAKSFVRYLEIIERFASHKGRLLDVGAATGFFLAIAKSRGWDVVGVELSAYAAARAKEKGFDVRVCSFSTAGFSTASIDVITMFDVLEHFTDPLRELREAARVLKPGGLLVINAPNASSVLARILGMRWHLIVPPEHLHYFSPENCTTYLATLGFHVCYSGSIWKSFTPYYIFHTLYRSQGFAIWRWLAMRCSNRLLKRIAIPLPSFDNFFLIAERKQV